MKTRPQEQENDGEAQYSTESLARAFLTFSIAAAAIVGASVVLANIGDRLAEEMGWEASFVGTQFLALSTSLPRASDVLRGDQAGSA